MYQVVMECKFASYDEFSLAHKIKGLHFYDVATLTGTLTGHHHLISCLAICNNDAWS
jgi:hypothetical protein